ncbi:MAG TPA: hypothetical protein VD707_03815 [Gemmatimonadales bacterium]|nr:hypothetical protein [Gemmatimonadales bacterium]
MQSSRVLRALPVVLALAASPLVAQAQYQVEVDGEWFHQEPGQRRLARLARGARVAAGGAAEGPWTRVTMEGWIFARSVGPANREGFDLMVTRAPEENLRAAPNGALVARLVTGVQLNRVAASGGWVRVRRDGWVRRAALAPVGGGAAASASDTARAGPDSVGVDPAAVRTARATALHSTPEGAESGRLPEGTRVHVVNRGEEWSRVQVGGWVRTVDLEAAPPGVLVGVTAAELRAAPQRYAGQVLRWTLQYIATQTGDELRPDIPAGAPYLLAKGPLPELGFVYVVVPDSLRAAAGRLSPLARIDVTARVRNGRSRYLGHPVLDLIAMETLR